MHKLSGWCVWIIEGPAVLAGWIFNQQPGAKAPALGHFSQYMSSIHSFCSESSYICRENTRTLPSG
jgi:hypothetical protein